MNKNNCTETVNRLFEQRRTADQTEANRRLAEVTGKIPDLREKDRALQALHASFFRFFLQNDGDEEEFKTFRQQSLTLQNEKRRLLTDAGYPADYLDPIWQCKVCHDEGTVDGHLCACYKQALSEEYLRQSGMSKLFSACSFASFDLSLYSDRAPENGGASPRETMKKLLSVARNYVTNFDKNPDNLLFFGEPGCGKTYLSVCIGCELIRRGKFVFYAPVQQLISDFEAETFRKHEPTVPTEDYLTADLLIIDDLGTEFYSSFVETTLYNVINTRLTRKKPTLISTNLSIDDRAATYADRLNSRLTYSYLNFGFPEEDLRAASLRRRSSKKQATDT